jgi:Flp pilus assembly protein TadG
LVATFVLFPLIFGIVDFGEALYAYHFVANAAREGTRYAIVRGSSCTGLSGGCPASSSDIQSYVQNLASGIGINSNSVTIDTTSSDVWPGTGPSGSCNTTEGNNSPGCIVQVKVVYPFNFAIPLLPTHACPLPTGGTTTANICMSSTSEMVISQ